MTVELAEALHLTRPLACIDLETTGTSVERDRIVQIAIVRLKPGGGVWEEYHGLVNPEIPIPAAATEVHGITDAMVATAPKFRDIVGTVGDLLRGCDVAGYNGRRYDVPLLRAEMARVNYCHRAMLDDVHIVDPLLIWRRQTPRTLTAAMSEFCGVVDYQGHQAVDDVRATIQVLAAQMERWPDLPRDVAGLSDYGVARDPSWIDSEGRLAWRDGEACITFGRHSGRPLQDLVRHERDYLLWCLSKDFPLEFKALVREALQGRFPAPPPPEEGDQT